MKVNMKELLYGNKILFLNVDKMVWKSWDGHFSEKCIVCWLSFYPFQILRALILIF